MALGSFFGFFDPLYGPCTSEQQIAYEKERYRREIEADIRAMNGMRNSLYA